MAEETLPQILKAVLMAAIVVTAIILMVQYVYPGAKDALSVLGFGENLLPDRSEEYVALSSTVPALNKNQIFAYSPTDFAGSKEELGSDQLVLSFDSPLNTDKAINCLQIWEADIKGVFVPSKKADWQQLDEQTRNGMLNVENRKMTIKGFIQGKYYRIQLDPCFQSWDNHPINPAAALLKFKTPDKPFEMPQSDNPWAYMG